MAGSHARRTVVRCLPLAALLGLAVSSPWRVGVVCGHSMEPTLRSGTLFFYKSGPVPHPERGEIVLVPLGGALCVKEVYALSGETFWAIRDRGADGTVLTPIPEAQVQRFRGLIGFANRVNPGQRALVRVVVPRGHVFLVGESSGSVDSRQLGPVPISALCGRVHMPDGIPLPHPAQVERRYPTPRPSGVVRAAIPSS